MDWTVLPPMASLRAFAALAETGSYTRAGTVLNVTHGAVVQQVRALESRLGVTLAVREGRGVRLTAEGEALARDLALGFNAIRRGVEALSEEHAHRPVQVSMSPAFAVSWLMPRLTAFQRAHPEITLLLNPTSEIVEMRPGGIDVAIRYTDRTKWTGDFETLLVAEMLVVGVPELFAGRDIARPADLLGMHWLQELGTEEVAYWFDLHGVEPGRALSISHMPGNLTMDAVRRGDGITYTARPFVEEELRAGRLLGFFPKPDFGIYHLRARPGVARPPVKTFLRWLKLNAAADPPTAKD